MECFYRSLRPSTIANVIKAGTISRAIWPIIPGVLYYQYARQVDEEVYSCDVLAAQDPSKAYDSRQPGWRGHWRVQEDIKILREAAVKH